jgi:energy-coupling factor transport system permease protein
MFDTFYGYIALTIFMASIIKLSKVPLKFILKGLKAIVIILLFTTTFNLFFTQGDVLVKIGFLRITKQGLYSALFMAVRLTYLILGSSIMTFTTTPNQLTDGLERLLNPLRRIKVPVHEIAMMMSIALRFIPILLEETDKIMKAQMARGADFESGGIIKRAKGLVPLLVPLFVSAFRRANDLAMAMEARCYRGGEGRTKMKPLHYKKNDVIAYIILILYIASVIAIGIYEKYLPSIVS